MTERHIQPVHPMIKPGGPRPMRPSAPIPTLTPKEIIGILRRHILMIVSLTIMGIITGGVAWFFLQKFQPKYTAITSVEVLPPVEGDPMAFATMQSNKDLYYQFRATKAAFIKQQNTLQALLRRDKIRETKWFEQFNNDIAKAVRDLEKKLGASAPRDSNWIRVSMQCGSAKESALIVNEMVDLFLDEQREMATKDVRAQLAERTKQQQLIKAQLLQSEDTLNIMRSGTDFTNLEGQRNFTDHLTQKLSNIEIEYEDMVSEISNLEGQVETLRIRAEGEHDIVVREQTERDNIAQGMRRNIASLEVALAQQLTVFGEDHRQTKIMREALKQAKADYAIRQEEIGDIRRKSQLRNAEDTLTILTKELESLEQQRIQAKQEYKDLDNLRANYQKIVTIRDEKQQLLEDITNNIEKLNMVFNDPEISKVKSIGLAPEPLRMSFPNIKIFLPAGFMLGFMLGVALAFAIELLNDLLRTPNDVMKYLQVPLLGTIYHADQDDYVEGIELCHVVRQAPYSIISESYRQFRINLKLSGTGNSKKILLVTSDKAGEGKTSVATNMAATLIAENRKVLLIDTNFRKPSTPTLFPLTEAKESAEHPDYGLSNYLMDQCRSEDIIRTSGIAGLDIIDSGPLPSNPAEILNNPNMEQLLEQCRRLYDYVIIDSPPLLVSEAKILAAQTDGTILVFNTESTKRGAAKRVLRELRSINADIIGSVLMGVRAWKGGYFQEIYKSYQQYQQAQLAHSI